MIAGPQPSDQNAQSPNSHAVSSEEENSFQPEQLPKDIQGWLRQTLDNDEKASACLLADLQDDNRFGEKWAFLTNKRLLVLESNGVPDKAEIAFELPVTDVRDADIRHYITSGELLVKTPERSHRVARFSYASRAEATDLCHRLKRIPNRRQHSFCTAASE